MLQRNGVTRARGSHLRITPSWEPGRGERDARVEDISAEIPGLSRALHVIRHRPSLTRLLHELERFEGELDCEVPGEHIPQLECDIRCIVENLLSIEDELWRPDSQLPWRVTHWILQAASFIAATQHAVAYVSRVASDRPEEALAALHSGAQYAGEAVLALCRFDAEALRLDEETAVRLESTLGWA